MSQVFRPNRKATDADIIRLNSLGLSLSTIGKRLGCHPTTVTLRLDQLGVKPADTRRAFMESILEDLSPNQVDWIAGQLGPHTSIKDYVKNLLVREFVDARAPSTNSEEKLVHANA